VGVQKISERAKKSPVYIKCQSEEKEEVRARNSQKRRKTTDFFLEKVREVGTLNAAGGSEGHGIEQQKRKGGEKTHTSIRRIRGGGVDAVYIREIT